MLKWSLAGQWLAGWLGGWLVGPPHGSAGFGGLRSTCGKRWVSAGQHGASAMGRAPIGTVDGHLAGGVVEPALGDGDHGLAAILPPP